MRCFRLAGSVCAAAVFLVSEVGQGRATAESDEQPKRAADAFPDAVDRAGMLNAWKHAERHQLPRNTDADGVITDPIRFQKDLKVTIQALGWKPKPGREYLLLEDDIASVAFWYQAEPHAKFPPLPSKENLLIQPLTIAKPEKKPGK